MKIDQQLLYSNQLYKILNAEHEFIIHPSALDILPLTQIALSTPFISSFSIMDYQLKLDKLMIGSSETLNIIGNKVLGSELYYEFNRLSVIYSGSILIAKDLIKEHHLCPEEPACFSYLKVLELVFEDGVLITTIDQSKAMQRIRKNLELGLRNLNNNRDLRCIRRFINSSIIGDYKGFRRNGTRMKYIKNMKNKYPAVSFTKQFSAE